MTLRTRIAAGASAAVALVVVASAVAVYVAVRTDLRSQIDHSLIQRAQAFVAPAPESAAGSPAAPPGADRNFGPGASGGALGPSSPRGLGNRFGPPGAAAGPGGAFRERSSRLALAPNRATCSSSRRQGRWTCQADREARRR